MMYAQPNTFKQLVRNLTQVIGSKEKARLLVYVELTLFLAEQLGLECEPLTVGWVLLSHTPLYHPQLDRLTPVQRRMRANAAIIVPLSSRYAWESALAQYSKDDEALAHLRLYVIAPTRLDNQMICICRQSPSPNAERIEYYERILTEQLPFEKRNRRYTEAEKTYKVLIKAADGEAHVGWVTITAQMQQLADQDAAWFDTKPARVALNISMSDLLPTAQFLDDYERRTGGRVHWEHDLYQIRFRRINHTESGMSLDEENAHPLILDGAIHLPGTVSAGKTTLAKLVIAHCIRLGWDVRITLVVGDTNSAIEIAHQVNSWFCESPEDEAVVAVPLLGVSQGEVNLGRLLASRQYRKTLKERQPHWGERWLMPICPLASRIKWEGAADVQLLAGSEPCQGLIAESGKGRGKRHLCPLFTICPSKQMYRDLPRARLWVTTPGALAQAKIPLHLDDRIHTFGDLVYEQSDLVILDEVETIVDWYDRTFARHEELTNGKNGLLDRLDTQISAYLMTNRVQPSFEHRWLMTVREAVKALNGVLTALANPRQERIAKNWVKRGYFAPNQLAYRLARRLAGLKEWDAPDTLPMKRHENDVLTQKTFEPFDELLNYPPDPLRPRANMQRSTKAAELTQIMQAMNNLADDVSDADLFEQCRDWILRWHPDIEEKLAKLRDQLLQSDDFDREYATKQQDRSSRELAARLQFTLLVALLDRHLHVVIHEWYHKPESLEAQQPFSHIPRGARCILPLPLTGQQYGFVTHTGSIKYNRDAANRLGLFSYTSIGRSYLLNFHCLRQDFDGESGPHVLALSGTSYLPDSTAFHVSIPPAGILLPSHQTEQAIKDSRFIWRPFTNESDKPIKISGAGNKEEQLRQLVRAMLADGGVPGGMFGRELEWLETQGQAHPDQWKDRARILLLTNSYSQSKAVAIALREGWRAADNIFDLKQAKGSGRDEDYQVESLHGNQLQRMDIEQFATHKNGRILVAPMQSIGRGFNILNDQPEPKAAFGAVFFLTRPMNTPNDREAIAQELNRYALAWAEDASFVAWNEDTLYQRALKARESAVKLTRAIERRRRYKELIDDAELRVYPRRDLAATTAGRIVQAVGRLLRGGVPFRAYFIDAAWSPELAATGDIDRIESEETSLLTALINIMDEYSLNDLIGQYLYGDLSGALTATENRDSN